MPNSSIKIVVFDLGGVLVRICRTWEEGCRAAGLTAHDGWDDPAAKAQRRALNAAYQRGEMSGDDYFTALAATARGLYTADDTRRIHRAWIIDEYPGIADVIRTIHNAGLATGALSNTNVAHWASMYPSASTAAPAYPSLRLIPHAHASHLLGVAKPDPEAYRAFERQTGFRPGQPGTADGTQILFFDDLEENIAAARTAGWHAHQIDHTGDTAAQMTKVLQELRLI